MDAIVDLFEFCRQGRASSGEAPLAALTRLDLANREGALRWEATGGRNAEGKDILRLGIAGSLRLVCQRCLEPLTLAVDLQRNYRVVRTEAEADALPLDDEEYDPVVGSNAFDLVALLEDEVLLSLPAVPRHNRCPDHAAGSAVAVAAGAAGQPAAEPPARPNPFAVLAQLKGKTGRGG